MPLGRPATSLFGLALLLSGSCSISADLDGKRCPCAGGWTCDTASDRCVRSDEMDSGPRTDAGSDGGSDSGPPGQARFVDDSSDTFGMGTFTSTRGDGDAVQLDGIARSGTLVSRVFDAGDSRAWTSLSWTPRAPYGKSLPDGRRAESGYPEGAFDMANNLLLLHLDEMADLNDGDSVPDTSGRGNNALVLSPGVPLRFVEGRLGNAVADRRDTYLYIPLSTTDDFDFGTSDFSWSLWVNTTEDCTDRNRVHLGVDGSATPTSHVWLGCSRGGTMFCPGEDGGRAAGYFRSDADARDGGGVCGTTNINDGVWHNLLVVKEGHASASLRLYVDGVMEAEQAASFDRPVQFPENPDLTIGDFTGGTYPAIGSFDEVAIWNRALSPAEVTAIHLRGAVGLSLQVRACDEPTCAGQPFVGPDGTSSSRFVDASGALEPTTTATLTGLTGRYVQYRAEFETLSPRVSAVLERVAMVGDPI